MHRKTRLLALGKCPQHSRVKWGGLIWRVQAWPVVERGAFVDKVWIYNERRKHSAYVHPETIVRLILPQKRKPQP